MSNPLVVKDTITIKSSAAAVWDMLTNPAQTKRYMFGCEALSEWKPGSPLLWKGNFNGVELVAVKGIVKKFDPPRLLVYTAIDPNNLAIPDIAENYLTVTCELEEEGGATRLTISQGDYSTVADGANRYNHTVSGGGWAPLLVEIKKLVESAPLPA